MPNSDDPPWNGLDTQSIRPDKGAKFSPNVYAWLMAPGANGFGARTVCADMYLDRSRSMWLGFWARPDHFEGQRLSQILSQGAAAGNSPKQPPGPMRHVPGFWDSYVTDGRCALDPHHISPLIASDFRWVKRRMGRQCCWCGRSFALPSPADSEAPGGWSPGNGPPAEA